MATLVIVEDSKALVLQLFVVAAAISWLGRGLLFGFCWVKSKFANKSACDCLAIVAVICRKLAAVLLGLTVESVVNRSE
jgi:hypothetical protein